MSTTRKKAPGKAQPAAALRTKPAPAKSASAAPSAAAPAGDESAHRPLRISLDPTWLATMNDLKALIDADGFVPPCAPRPSYSAVMVVIRTPGGFMLFPTDKGALDGLGYEDACAVASTTPELRAHMSHWADAANPNGTL